MSALTPPDTNTDRGATNEASRSSAHGRRAAFLVVGFLASLLPLNTYWGVGGTRGIGWVLGCADCTVPLALVWLQEVMIGVGILVLLGRIGAWRSRLPGWIWGSGTWMMALVLAAVGGENLIGDNTLQARLLFGPLALVLSGACAVAASSFGRAEDRRRRPTISAAAPPRWARRAAPLAVLTTVPSGLWRVGMAVGVPVGVDDEYRRTHYGFPGWGTVYVFGLTTLLVGLALLGLGLVQRWGEVVPHWIPFVGGRAVRPLAAVIPAGIGSVALTLLWITATANVQQIWAVYGLDGFERVVMAACYTPLLLWGPLLGALTVSYHRRHRPAPGRSLIRPLPADAAA